MTQNPQFDNGGILVVVFSFFLSILYPHALIPLCGAIGFYALSYSIKARRFAIREFYWLLALALPQRYSSPAVLVALVGWTILRVGILPPFAAAYLLGSCYLLGRRVSKGSDVATQILIGMAGTIFCVWWAIHLPINYRWVYWVVLGLPYLTVRPLPRLSLPSRSIGTLACGFFLAAQWVMVLKPEISADGLSMHLALPMEVARSHQWHFDVTRAAWAVMPAAGDSFFTAAYMLGGEGAAQLANLGVLFLLCALIVQACRTWLDIDRAYLAAALFASTMASIFVCENSASSSWAVFARRTSARASAASNQGGPPTARAAINRTECPACSAGVRRRSASAPS